MRNVNPIKVGDTQLYHGDARQVLFHLDSNSLDSCVTDSPYHLSAGNGSRGFMGMDWDGGCIAFDASFWSELLRVLKPGAFLLTLGHPRTSHRMATAIEKSGFEIRDTITWIRGQGMPYGKQLKGLNEPGVLARKPLEGSLSSNMAKWGVGELFVERCRVNGRFPSNTIISPEVADILKRKAKFFFCPRVSLRERNAGCDHIPPKPQTSDGKGRSYNDRCAVCGRKFVGAITYRCQCPPGMKKTDKTRYTNCNHHPTVKPVTLMEYLVSLVTPVGGTLCDCFMGSGSTGIAAINLDLNFIGIEKKADYLNIAKARLKHAIREKKEKLNGSKLKN